ncbi:hypothetical protein Lser_V15G36963 [Lactuca serriola]
MHTFIGSSVEQRENRSKAAAGGLLEEANRKEEGEGVAYLRQTFSGLFLVAGSRKTNGQQQQRLAAVEQESKWLFSGQGKQRKLTGNRKRKKMGMLPLLVSSENSHHHWWFLAGNNGDEGKG